VTALASLKEICLVSTMELGLDLRLMVRRLVRDLEIVTALTWALALDPLIMLAKCLE